MKHWHCTTHGDFDARVAVGCPDCMRLARDEIKHLHRCLTSAMDRLDRIHTLAGSCVRSAEMNEIIQLSEGYAKAPQTIGAP